MDKTNHKPNFVLYSHVPWGSSSCCMDMRNQDNAAEFAGTMDSTAAEGLQSLLPLAETDRPEITEMQK